MSTMILQSAGEAVGGAIGGPIGAMIGRTAGGMAGSAIDNALFGSGGGNRIVEGPRLKDMDGLSSTEGAPIPRLYGRARLGGQLIWATRFEEQVNVTVERSGSQGGKSLGGGGSKTTNVAYSYYANLAIGLCEGPISFVRRVWADGREVDIAGVTMRIYRGTQSQAPDGLMVAKEGEGNVPAYRGLAYVVFERLPLEPFGNRVPQFTFEVVRALSGVNAMVRSVCLIPGASEFGYEPTGVMQVIGPGEARPDNRHQFQARSDVVASLDALQQLCPNLEGVSLVVSWFGDDLRAGHCTIAPRVEIPVKQSDGAEWSVAGLARAEARLVSLSDGKPAYGGTPSDASVIALIRNLKARGLSVTIYPFVMMDIPAGNTLPDPYTGTSGQPAYPWRGRITCDPVPGTAGSVDGAAEAESQVSAFFGSVSPVANEWSFRRHILHYAQLAAQAGGVQGIIIGSEMIALTRVRSASGVYPAATALAELAGDVRTIVGSATKITYAADWTEYGAHVRDGGAEVRFPLDPLWAHPAIDAIGIDYYPPISDWRDGSDHLDAGEARNVYDLDYLSRRLGSGEAFDWYYMDAASRAAQLRLPINDGAYGKPWIFRQKDLLGWWSNPHVERVAGVEIGATEYVPEAKPIWLTEIGIPAVDKGPNGPNVFPDPKSSEAAFPPFSRRTRDDLAQARGLEAIFRRFDPDHPQHNPAHNPISSVYGGRMVDPARIAVWAWDARPFPAFPDFTSVWADGGNYETGHWVTGRFEGMALDRLVRNLLMDFGIEVPVDIVVDGFIDGLVIDRPMSVRAALEPLMRLFGVDVSASDGILRWRGRGGRVVANIDAGDLVDNAGAPLLRRVRAQETDLPAEVVVGYTDADGDYRRAATASRRLAGSSRREARIETAVVINRSQAENLADILLQDTWAARDSAEFALAPGDIAIETGDIIALPGHAGSRLHRVTRIVDGTTRSLVTHAVEPALFETPGTRIERVARKPPLIPGKPFAIVLDLPIAAGEPPVLQYLAAYADPWPGALAIWRSIDGQSFNQHGFVSAPAQIGVTETVLAPGTLWRWDRSSSVEVSLSSGSVASVSEVSALAGANNFAFVGADGVCEIVCVAESELIGEKRYRLSGLLRGLGGSEGAASRTLPPGAVIVRLDESIVPLAQGLTEMGRNWMYRLGPVGRDHADNAARSFEAVVGRAPLQPFEPVHVRAQRESEGVRITWVRRSRIEGDSWEPVDIPLGEESERYALEIHDGESAIRRIETTSAQTIYSTHDEIDDFGSPRASLDLRVVQISASVGDGKAFAGSVPVF